MKFQKFITVLLINVLTLHVSVAQSFQWGVKGGMSMGLQAWNGGGTGNNSHLWGYHGAAFWESGDINSKSRIFAQLGYHQRGSATRFPQTTGFDINGVAVDIPSTTINYIYNNVSLAIGARRSGIAGNENAYYGIGIRGEYTVSTNFEDNPFFFSFGAPQKEFVRKINYGLSLIGGYDFRFSDMVGGFVELTISPDLSNQYYRQAINNLYDTFTRQRYSIPEQTVRNTTIELTVGFRFLRKIEYID